MSPIKGFLEVQAAIAERRPLLMVDRLEVDGSGRRARGVKAVSMDEEFFQGHFPGAPIMPGVLQVAAMCQVGGVLIERQEWQVDHIPWLRGLHRTKFRKPVVPGDLLVIEAWLEDGPVTPGEVLIGAQTLVNGEVTCQGQLRMTLCPLASLRVPPAELLSPLPPVTGVEVPHTLSTREIMKWIPHRYPFLLIDRILHLDAGRQRIVGLKNITANEPFFAGLPVPAVPGFLQVEMAAQVGCVLALSLPENQNKLGIFMAIDEADFLIPVIPGDRLVLDIVTNLRPRFGKGEAQLFVGERLVSRVAIKFAVVDREAAEPGA